MPTPLEESSPDEKRRELIASVTRDAAAYLSLDLGRNSAKDIVTEVNHVIMELVFGEATPIPDSEQADVLLGCLWGSQMVRELGWSWANLQFDSYMDMAVVSPSRDMAIYPFTFVGRCIAKQCICTVALSFNMLRERGAEAAYPPGSYEDVMGQIHHIVPPYTLGPAE
jgi:hypothetical protein